MDKLWMVLVLASAAAYVYDEVATIKQIELAQASYCVGTDLAWSCPTCNSGITLTTVVEDRVCGGRALVGYDAEDDTIFVSYRGSEDLMNWIDNIKVLLTYPYDENPLAGIESGFHTWYSQLGEKGVFAAVLEVQAQFNATSIKVTGHSAGAACATQLAVDVARRADWLGGLELTIAQLTTFGSPRVGNAVFAEFAGALGVSSTRVTHYYDLVPHVPPELLFYQHVGTEVWYNEDATQYTVCDGTGEDLACSNSCSPLYCTSIDDHLTYLNVTLGFAEC